jgi:hypothetical protein
MRRSGSTVADASAGAALLGTGACMAVSASLHIVANAVERIGQPAPVYDFRIYSLLCLGVFLLGNAVMCIRRAAAVAAADPRARRETTHALLRIGAAAAPLIPFVPHAWYFTVFVLIDLAALRLARCGTLAVHETSLYPVRTFVVRRDPRSNAPRLDEGQGIRLGLRQHR